MGVVQNIIGMVRDIHDRQENAKINHVLQDPNVLNDPQAAFKAIYQINPQKAYTFQDEAAKRSSAQAAADEAAFNTKLGRLGVVFKMLRNAPPDQVGAAFDRFAPVFNEMNVDPQALAAIRQQAEADPSFLPSMDDDAYKAMIKDQYTTTVATPGSHVLRGGKKIDEVPFSYKPVTAGSAQTGYVTKSFDPNTGEFGTSASGPGVPGVGASPAVTPENWSTETLAPHFVQQETHGDYTAVNKDTGALGAYQIMPDTGKALAAQIGVAWRPDMMVKDDPISRRYQDAIGHRAISEAVQAGGGDPDTTFAYYYGGPDRSKWGPKTREYVQEMRQRVGLGRSDGQEATVSPNGITIPAAPQKPAKHVRAATPDEIASAGYPAGTAAQVDETGKFVNIHVPPASKTPANKVDTGNVLALLDNIEGGFNDLHKMGALPGEGALVDSLGRTSVGQWIGEQAGLPSAQKRLEIAKNVSGLQQEMLKSLPASATRTRFEQEIMKQGLPDPMKMSYPTAIRVIKQLRESYLRAVKDSGGAPAAAPAASGPKVGDVEQGYRFKGGNPADQSNWEKVK